MKSTLPSIRIAFVLGLDAVELDAGIGGDRRDAGKPAEEIEMPPGAAEFAVGGELEADLLLLLDDLLDLAVFDRLERVGGDLALWRIWRAPPSAARGAAGCRPCRRGTAAWCGRSFAPHLFGQFHDHAQLGPLLVLGQHVAFLGGGKAALRRQAKLIERDIFGRLLDALLDVFARLQPARTSR